MPSPEVSRRRTFAIISHPDAGKTTLTEKLLLFGGAIQLAGAVKAKGEARRARSDWMAIEQQRGISVSASVMTFEYGGNVFNLLGTPGHQDFSEDTYRTLTAVDSAIMVLDAAKGIEAQTLKLFEVCRLRNVPIITFINKCDRESKSPFDLLDEIERTLALEVTPVTWPVGTGQDFKGCYDLLQNRFYAFTEFDKSRVTDSLLCEGLNDPTLKNLLPPAFHEQLVQEAELTSALCPPLALESYREGHLTPVFFGSALHNFGVRELLQGIARYAPPPRAQKAETRLVEPGEEKVSGFVFKVQANMDPKHRDRVAFVRLCSGHFTRGMKLFHVRDKKTMAVYNPVLFLAQDRELAEEAWAGDIIGIPNHGNLRIGDSLTEGEALRFSGIPSFAPELLQRVRVGDPLKVKHLRKALLQLAEEGASQIFRPLDGADWIVGVVGALQFEVIAARLRAEYSLEVRFEAAAFFAARWVFGEEGALKDFAEKNKSAVGEDHDDALVFLARNHWHLDTAQKEWPMLAFKTTRETVLA